MGLRQLARSLDFLCLPPRFPLFCAALECGTQKTYSVRGCRTSHGRDPIAIGGVGDSPWLYQEQRSYRWLSVTAGARIVAPGIAQEILRLPLFWSQAFWRTPPDGRDL